MPDTCHEDQGFETSEIASFIVILLGLFGNDLSILDIGISDIDLVRYRNES